MMRFWLTKGSLPRRHRRRFRASSPRRKYTSPATSKRFFQKIALSKETWRNRKLHVILAFAGASCENDIFISLRPDVCSSASSRRNGLSRVSRPIHGAPRILARKFSPSFMRL